jgi:hypothetical protein
VSAAAQKPHVIEEESGEDDTGSIEAAERALGPLSHVDLRHNALSGSIVLADYGVSYLCNLPISERSQRKVVGLPNKFNFLALNSSANV